MSAQFFQIFNFAANILVFSLAIYFFTGILKREKELEKKEKELAKKEGSVDTHYHQVVDNALSKERKILDDATAEAEKIIINSQYVSHESKELINKALQTMVADIQKEAVNTSRTFMNDYQASLKKLALESLTGFQQVASSLNVDLQKQQQLILNTQKDTALKTNNFTAAYQESIKKLVIGSLEDFQKVTGELKADLETRIKYYQETLLPGLEKEIAQYKEARLKQSEQTIARIVQKTSQRILNKLITLEEHKDLIIESLEKAKKEGIFD